MKQLITALVIMALIGGWVSFAELVYLLVKRAMAALSPQPHIKPADGTDAQPKLGEDNE